MVRHFFSQKMKVGCDDADYLIQAVYLEKSGWKWRRRFKGSVQRESSGSGVTSALGTWYGGVVMGVLSSFDEARRLSSILGFLLVLVCFVLFRLVSVLPKHRNSLFR
jgi:hypothetical protein